MASNMQDEASARWTVWVSKKTDTAVRTFLAQRGSKKGDLSKFIEDAVRWRLLDRTVAEARDKFSDLPADELEKVIDEACASSRQQTESEAR